MEKKHFTLDEANALIPYLTKSLTELRQVKNQIMSQIEILEEKNIDLENLFKKSDLTLEEQGYRQNLEILGDQINSVIFDIQNKGVLVKDIETGLVDFYANIDDQEVFLCWKLGEPEVEHWHELDSGYPGRKTLFTKEKGGARSTFMILLLRAIWKSRLSRESFSSPLSKIRKKRWPATGAHP